MPVSSRIFRPSARFAVCSNSVEKRVPDSMTSRSCIHKHPFQFGTAVPIRDIAATTHCCAVQARNKEAHAVLDQFGHRGMFGQVYGKRSLSRSPEKPNDFVLITQIESITFSLSFSVVRAACPFR